MLIFNIYKGSKINLPNINTLNRFRVICIGLLVRTPCHLKCLGRQRVPNRMLQELHSPIGGYVAAHLPLRSPQLTPHTTSFFPCVALVMPFSRDTLLELSMMLTRVSGVKSLRDPLVYQRLGEWVASGPLARARWYEAIEVAQLPLIRNMHHAAIQCPPTALSSVSCTSTSGGQHLPATGMPPFLALSRTPQGAGIPKWRWYNSNKLIISQGEDRVCKQRCRAQKWVGTL